MPRWLSTAVLLLSAWGTVQLSATGLFFHLRSVALVEDIATAGSAHNSSLADGGANFLEVGYQQSALNCWIAAALYLGTFCVSACARVAASSAVPAGFKPKRLTNFANIATAD